MTTITTTEELQALPVGSVVLLCDGRVALRAAPFGFLPWLIAGFFGSQCIYNLDLPATVLYAPGQPAPAGAVPRLDRVTDLFEKWAAEENEHRVAGEFGLAEGLHVAIEDLREAVHGAREGEGR